MHTDMHSIICVNLCASVFELSALDYYQEYITLRRIQRIIFKKNIYHIK